MPITTRRAATVKKQQQYRISDDEDEDDDDDTKDYGGILASLSHNVQVVPVPSKGKTTNTKQIASSTKHNKKKAAAVVESDRSSSDTGGESESTPPRPSKKRESNNKSTKTPPPTSVVIGKMPSYFSPPTQAAYNKNGRNHHRDHHHTVVDGQQHMNDGVSVMSCDIASPPLRTRISKLESGSEYRADVEDVYEDDDKTLPMGEEEEGASFKEGEDVETVEKEDPDETLLEDDEDATDDGDEEDLLSEPDSHDDDESAVSEEFDDDEDEYEPEEDDEYVPDEDEESASEDELEEGYVEEEEEKPTRGRRPQKNATQKSDKENTPAGPDSKNRNGVSLQKKNEQKGKSSKAARKAELAEVPSSPVRASSRDFAETPARDDEATVMELTPAPERIILPNFISMELDSPEPQVAFVLDSDDDSDDDVLVATILAEDESSVVRSPVGYANKNTPEWCDEDQSDNDEGDAFDLSSTSEEEHDVSNEQDAIVDQATNNQDFDTGIAVNTSTYTNDTQSDKENNDEDSLMHSSVIGDKSRKTPTPTKEATEQVSTPNKKTKTSRKSFYRQEGKIKRGKWILGSKIGVGSFGSVHVGMNTLTGTLMAIKRFKMNGAIMADVRREIELMRSLDHKNIVRYFGAQMDKTHLHIFQAWVPGGSVASLLGKFGSFSLQVIRSYLSQTLSGLAYLHDNDIMHRDIKGSNILVNDEGIVKLADFGASKKLENLQANVMMSLTVRGTPYFMAPEVFEEKYSAKADIWGVGCVAFQMITSVPPWKDKGFTNPISLFNHIKNHDGPPPMDIPNDLLISNEDRKAGELFESLVRKCFQRDSSSRPTTSELLDDPFFIEMHDGADQETSPYRGLFSPGNETTTSRETMNTGSPVTPEYASNTPSPRRFPSPSPQKHSRSKSVIQWKTSFMSPPRSTPPRTKRNQERSSPSPMRPSPQPMSPQPDTSEWPAWARAQLNKKKLFTKSPASRQTDQNLSDLMGSLALSADSASRSQNPFRRASQGRTSTVGSAANSSNLIGLELLDDSRSTYEL